MERVDSTPIQAAPTWRPAQRRAGLLSDIGRHWQDYLFIAPFFVIFGVFFAYPVAWAFVLSFQRWNGISDATWVGIDNYRFVLNDPVTRKMFENTLRNLLVLVPLGVILPLACGVVLNQPGLRLRGLFRTVLFIPTVCSLVVVGIIWKLLFGTANGWLNGLLAHIGLGPYNWLKDPTLANVPIYSLTVWGGLGFATLIVLGGLQSIDADIYDAAKVDGSGAWNTFWRITLPLMRPVLIFLLITSTIGVMTMFGQPYVVTSGGPRNATLTPLLHIYNIGIGGTGGARVGDAAALSFVLTAAMIVIVGIQLWATRRRGDA